MAYGAAHLLLRFMGHRGTIATEQLEYWSASVRIDIGPSLLTEAKKAAFLTALDATTQAFHGGSGVSAGTNSYLDKLTAAYIHTDGKYVGGDAQPTTEYIFSAPVAGQGGTTMPFSHARVWTLETDIDRGRGSIGRFYWTCGLPVDATGRWTQNQCTDARNAGVTFLDAINNAAEAQWSTSNGVSVFSRLSGEIGRVLRVGVGRAPDTQRRRDNRLLEDRVMADVPTAAGFAAAVQARTYETE